MKNTLVLLLLFFSFLANSQSVADYHIHNKVSQENEAVVSYTRQASMSIPDSIVLADPANNFTATRNGEWLIVVDCDSIEFGWNHTAMIYNNGIIQVTDSWFENDVLQVVVKWWYSPKSKEFFLHLQAFTNGDEFYAGDPKIRQKFL
jgi:hypothetical protein